MAFQKTGRVYEVDGKLVTIYKEVLQKFVEWGTHGMCSDLFYDKKMVQILLVIVVGSAEIANGNISDKAQRFVKGQLRWHLCVNSSDTITRKKKLS